MLVSSFNLSQSFNYIPYLFYKKRLKSEINSFCIWTLVTGTVYIFGPLKIFSKCSREDNKLFIGGITIYIQCKLSYLLRAHMKNECR